MQPKKSETLEEKVENLQRERERYLGKMSTCEKMMEDMMQKLNKMEERWEKTIAQGEERHTSVTGKSINSGNQSPPTDKGKARGRVEEGSETKEMGADTVRQIMESVNFFPRVREEKLFQGEQMGEKVGTGVDNTSHTCQVFEKMTKMRKKKKRHKEISLKRNRDFVEGFAMRKYGNIKICFMQGLEGQLSYEEHTAKPKQTYVDMAIHACQMLDQMSIRGKMNTKKKKKRWKNISKKNKRGSKIKAYFHQLLQLKGMVMRNKKKLGVGMNRDTYRVSVKRPVKGQRGRKTRKRNHGVNVNIRNVHNTIPLHMALARGVNSCVSLLLDSGSDCNIQDDEGDNTFYIAADATKMIRENFNWLMVMLRSSDAAVDVRNHSGKTVSDFLEALPREWISEDLMEALLKRGVHLSPTIYEVGDWVKFKRGITTPLHGWQGAKPKSVGFGQTILEKEDMIVTFCCGEARVVENEVVKLIPLDRGQHVRLRTNVKEPRFGRHGQSWDSVGTVLCVDDDGILRVGLPGESRGWKADPAEMERVKEFKFGDWIRVKASMSSPKYGLGDITRNSIGIMHSLDEDGDVGRVFCFRSKPFSCSVTENEKVVPFHMGLEIHMTPSITQPRLGWSKETPSTIGKIVRINMDGTLSAHVTGRQTLWRVSPGDAELLSGLEVGDWVCSKPNLGNRPSYDWFSVRRESIVVINSIQETCYLELACCLRKGRWSTHYTDLEKIPSLKEGQFVKIQKGVTEPIWGWRGAKLESRGIITTIHADEEVRGAFFGLLGLEVEPNFEVGEWIRLREGISSWESVGPGRVGVVHGVGYEGKALEKVSLATVNLKREARVSWVGFLDIYVTTFAGISGKNNDLAWDDCSDYPVKKRCWSSGKTQPIYDCSWEWKSMMKDHFNLGDKVGFKGEGIDTSEATCPPILYQYRKRKHG